MEETISDLCIRKKPMVMHKHRPRTLKVCFNTNCVIVIYCADCGCQISQYIQEIEYQEYPIDINVSFIS